MRNDPSLFPGNLKRCWGSHTHPSLRGLRSYDKKRPMSPLLSATRAVVEEAERNVLRARPKWRIFDFILRNSFFSIPFLLTGIEELMMPLFKWWMLGFALLLITLFAISKSDLPPEAISYVFWFCSYGSLILVAFALPSTYAFDSINSSEIEALAEFISQLGFDCDSKLKMLGENISLVATRVDARTIMFQRVVAVVWGIFFFWATQYTNLIIKLTPPDDIPKLLLDSFFSIFWFFLVSLLSVVAIIGYKKANNAVFRRIQFAIEELKFSVATKRSLELGEQA